MSEVEPVSDPATAFDSLRGELALLRRCVEQLAAERNDFRPTIEQLVERQDNVAGWLKHFSELPSIKLTPAQFAHDFSVATEHLRAEDREAVVEADRAIQRAIGRIESIVGRAYSILEQRGRLIQAALGGAGAAIILCSFLPGVVARTLPESWHVPEWMAMRTMALDERQAGERLLLLAKQRAAAVSERAPAASAGDQGESYNQVSANGLPTADAFKAKSLAAPLHRRNHSRSHRPYPNLFDWVRSAPISAETANSEKRLLSQQDLPSSAGILLHVNGQKLAWKVFVRTATCTAHPSQMSSRE